MMASSFGASTPPTTPMHERDEQARADRLSAGARRAFAVAFAGASRDDRRRGDRQPHGERVDRA